MTEELILQIVLSLSLSLALWVETIFIWQRYIGSRLRLPTLGYSSHVRAATIGRFFILLAAPLYGFLVDSGSNFNELILVAIFVHLIFIIISFRFLTRIGKINEIFWKKINSIHKDISWNITKPRYNLRFAILSMLSFMILSNGINIVNIIAAGAPAYKATIIQSSAVFTMAGTLLHIFFIDPELSEGADSDSGILESLIYSNIFGRILGSLFSVLILLICLGYLSI